MSFRGLLTQAVTIVTAGEGTDAYDNPVDDWGSATESTVPGLVQQTATVELVVDRDTVLSDYLLFLLPDADIDSHRRARVDGVTYEVIGQPDLLRTPRGPHHYEVRLRRVEG